MPNSAELQEALHRQEIEGAQDYATEFYNAVQAAAC
jgi:hypothetical protein